MAGIKAQKSALRSKMKSVLSQLSPTRQWQESQELSVRVFQNEALSSPKTKSVCCYLPQPKGEVDTTGIIQRLFHMQKRVYVPLVHGKGEMSMVRVNDFAELAQFQRNKWKIPEPTADKHEFYLTERNALSADSEDIDVMIVPGLAFDGSGHRLGRGGGYYDRYIDSYMESGRRTPHLLGLCFSCQLVDEMPVEPHDFVVDNVIHGFEYGC